MKIVNVLVILSAVCILSASSSFEPSIFASSVNNAPLIPSVQPPGIGCWMYTATDPVWESVPCFQANSTTAANTGVLIPTEGSSAGVEGAQPNPSCCIISSEVQVTFSQFSGESDSKYGSNAWSIQLNSNQFTGSNGQDDWIQFTYQQPYNIFGNDVCVWQNDLTTQSYNSVCTAVPTQTLSSSYSAYVEGAIPTCSNCHDLSDEFCFSSTCYSVVTSDTYAFYNNHWTQSSGDILGAGDSSQAQFTSPTTVYTGTTVTEFQQITASGIKDTTTQETNNLNYYSTGISCGSWNGFQQSCTENAYSDN